MMEDSAKKKPYIRPQLRGSGGRASELQIPRIGKDFMDTKRIEWVIGFVAYLSTLAGFIAGGATLLLFCLVAVEIFLRVFFHFSLLVTVEVSEWLLICIVFMGAAWTLKEHGHVRITLLISRLQEQTRKQITIVVSIICIEFFIWVSIYAWGELIESYVTGVRGQSIARLPLWWAWIPLCMGVSTLGIQFLGELLENVSALWKLGKKRAGINSLVLALFIISGLTVGMWFWASSNIIGLSWFIYLSIILFGIFVLILSSLWISISLMIVATMAMFLFTTLPVSYAIPQLFFSVNASFTLVCLPLFILMGELIYRSGASSDLYSGISPWVENIPGRLLHSNILACTLFAAISGSSSVTCATMASVAVPELKSRGYNRSLCIGSLAGAGTLGLLIPPSIALIVYGALTNTSIGSLFAGGIIPGLMISGLFISYIAILAILRPSVAPASRIYTWEQRIKGLLKVLPASFVILIVLGSIYTGIATPTEAATVGCACALIITCAYRKLTWKLLWQALFISIKTTSMIMLIYTGASALSSAMAYMMIPQHLAQAIAAMNVSRYTVLCIIYFIYIVIGCLFDGVSMMVLTLPIIFPLICKLGFDPVWFGVVLTILIETAQITPPVGLNLYVLQSISGERIETIAIYSIPFFMILILGVVIVTFFPNIILFLPSVM